MSSSSTNVTSILFLGIAFLMAGCSSSEPEVVLSEAEQRLPENALAGLAVADGLEAQLFASEPMVRNPTNIDVDAKGRVWVTEGINYRPWANPDNPYQEEGDQIIILEDTDEDGMADKRTVFYQGVDVDVALGIAVLDNKVIVSASPNVIVLTDTDGDDKADTKEYLFTGISNPQNDHSLHAFVFGPDGRYYFNFGNAGHQIADASGNPIISTEGHEVNDSGNPYHEGMAFRVNPDGSNFEVLGHNFRNNYELAVDSYGSVFQSDNDDDGNKAVRINYVMEYGNYGYRDEQTGAGWNTRRTGQHPNIPDRHWHQNDPGVVPNFLITGSGSPTGIMVYEGSLLPERFQNQIIHSDAGPGITRAYPAVEKGAGFDVGVANILHREQDSWHRPSDVAAAPDGSLFISDWYDPGVGANLAGDALRGRIFRVSPEANRYQVSGYSVDSPMEAVETLKSPNMARRYLAWMKLEAWDSEAEDALLSLWEGSNSRLRARALWLLARIDGKTEHYIQAALGDSDPQIRMTAIRVARQLASSKLATYLESLQQDPSSIVRREIAIGLREVGDESKAASIWAELAAQHNGNDRWYLEALGIGAAGRWDSHLDAWLAQAGDNINTPGGRDIIWRSRTSQSIPLITSLLADTSLALDEAARLFRATDFNQHPEKDALIANLMQTPRTDGSAFKLMALQHVSREYAERTPFVRLEARALINELRGTIEYLDLMEQFRPVRELRHVYRMALTYPNHELGIRAGRLLVEFHEFDWYRRELQEGNDPGRKAAVVSLLPHLGGEGRELLFEVVRDTTYSNALRRSAIQSLGIEWGWEERMTSLLDDPSLEEGLKKVAASRLLGANRPIDRARARAYLGQGAEASNWPAIQTLAEIEGDASAGEELVAAYCGNCHMLNGAGIAFGPDLSEIGNKLGKEALLLSIMNPDAGITFGYQGHVVHTKDEQTLVGYILSDTPSELIIRSMGGLNTTISQSNVASRQLLDNSLMTAGLHEVMGQEQLINLVEYLASLKNPATQGENPFQGSINYERASGK